MRRKQNDEIERTNEKKYKRIKEKHIVLVYCHSKRVNNTQPSPIVQSKSLFIIDNEVKQSIRETITNSNRERKKN